MIVRTADSSFPAALRRAGRAGNPPEEAAHRERVESSRRLILDAIGDSADVTLVTGVGNVGDQLIAAGTRALLAARPYREMSFESAVSARGHVALLCGGGAWCAPYHELMPRMLPVLERNFDRVVVLPSSFDLSVAEVKEAISGTHAIVFAREPESFHQIQSVCEARLALDCAFFFDFAPWRKEDGGGFGALDAFRTDTESSGLTPVPAGNRDISLTCSSLDEWLWTIAKHELVRTDRAHVLIAAALLGKEVEYRASSYHKLPEIATFALAGFPVRRTDPETRKPAPAREPSHLPDGASVRERLVRASAANLARLPAVAASGKPRVTIILVSWNRPEQIRGALRSVRESLRSPYRVILVDNNSGRETRELVKAEAGSDPRIELVLENRSRSCVLNRTDAMARATTEFVFFLDDDAEIFPGTIEILVHALDSEPAALAVASNIVLPNGTTQICGGDFHLNDGVAYFAPLGAGYAFDAPEVGAPGPCRWAAGAGALFRRAALERFPLDSRIGGYYEDTEWGFRVERALPGVQRRRPEALVLHHQIPKDRRGSGPLDLAHAIRFVEPIAHFYDVHGVVMEALFGFVPELTTPSGRKDVPAARLFLELLSARGAQWTLSQWLAGSLAPLFPKEEPRAAEPPPAPAPAAPPPEPRIVVVEVGNEELGRIHASRWWKLANAYWAVGRSLRSLLGRGRKT